MGRGVAIVGTPGAGKGTQGERLAAMRAGGPGRRARPDGADGGVPDGFPRTVAQAAELARAVDGSVW